MVIVEPTCEQMSDHKAPRIKFRTIFLIACLAFALLGVGVWYRWMRSGLASARDALAVGDPIAARKAIKRYLQVDPRNTEALMLAGTASLEDDSIDQVAAANQALVYFSRIPDNAPTAALARSFEGRAAFLILQEPARAERLFQRSIQLDPDQFDAHYLLWQLFNMTERYFLGETTFREVYRLCPLEQRSFRLREWYSSQFSPLSACSQLDLMMHFRESEEVPSEEIARKRLSSFLDYEPQEPSTAAAMAQWHLRNQSRESALEVLESIKDRESAHHNQFYQALFIETLIEIGQLERAGQEFKKWDSPHEGYQYWRLAGMHAQDVEGDTASAAIFLSQAIQAWPGPSDWLLMNRLSRCLALQGRREDAQKMDMEAKRVEELTTLTVHQKVRAALSQLDNPDALEEVVRFYEAFHRDWEAQAWTEVIASLRKSNRQKDAIVPTK